MRVQAQRCVPTPESLEPTGWQGQVAGSLEPTGWQGQVAGKKEDLFSQSFPSTKAPTFKFPKTRSSQWEVWALLSSPS